MRLNPKYIFLFAVCGCLSAAAGTAIFNNSAPGDSNWSSPGNWSGGLPPGVSDDVQLNATGFVLDVPATVKSVYSSFGTVGNLASSSTGGTVLTVDVNSASNADGIYNAYNTDDSESRLEFDGNVDVINSGGASADTLIGVKNNRNNAALVFGSNSVLTVDTRVQTMGSFGAIELNGIILGNDAIRIASDNVVLGVGHDSSGWNSGFIYVSTGAKMVVNGGTVLSPNRKFQVNTDGCELEVNAGNAIEGYFSIANNRSLLLDINADQGGMGRVILGAGCTLTVDLGDSVTEAAFAKTTDDWQDSTLVINNFSSGVVSFGSDASGLLAANLDNISATGAGGFPVSGLGIDADGSLTGIVATAGSVVANYRDDFSADAPLTSGWQYLWNAPSGWVANASSGDERSGFVGVPGEYVPLMDAGNYWTPDGDTSGTNNTPAGYLKLTGGGGHPGKNAAGANSRDRYAIAAFTVPSNGFYSITNSFISKTSSNGDAVEVLVFPGVSSPVIQREAEPASTNDFDCTIGYLDAGQTIYVAIGPGATASSDSFQMDYEILHVPGTDIQQQINAAVTAGDTNVVLMPGRYYSNKTARHVDLNNISDLTIQAAGVTLIGQTPYRGFELQNCHNVTLNGLTLDYDPVLHVQGTIEAIGSNWLNLRVHEGYPIPSDVQGSTMVYEPTGDHPLKQAAAQRYPKEDGTELEKLEPDLVRINFNAFVSDSTQVGDYFSILQPINIPHGMAILDSTQVTVDGVTVHSAPTFGIIADGGGDLTFNNVQVVPGEKPLLASVKRLRSSGADGIHVKSSSGNIQIENCRLEYTGDDSLVLTSPYAMVVDAPSSDVVRVVFKRYEFYAPGDLLELYEHASTQRVEQTLVSMTTAPLSAAQVQALTDQYFPDGRFVEYMAYDLTLDAPVNAAPGDFISNDDRSNEGFLIAGCHVQNTRARGILIKAGSGVISNCVVDTTWLSGLQLRPEPAVWLEGDYARNVQVIGNTFNNCGIISQANGSIRLDSEDAYGWNALGHENILFENNVVSNAPGISLYMAYAANVELRDNSFCNSHEWMVVPYTWTESVIFLHTVSNVSFTGTNWVRNLGPFADPDILIRKGGNVKLLSGQLYRPFDEVVMERNPDYVAWKDNYSLAQGADGNDDGDQLNNFAEFALGGDPTNSNDIGYVPSLGSEGGGVEYVHVQRRDATLGYSLELSDNLVSNVWTTGGYTIVSTNWLDPDFDVVTNQIPDAGKTSEFIRLIIEQL